MAVATDGERQRGSASAAASRYAWIVSALIDELRALIAAGRLTLEEHERLLERATLSERFDIALVLTREYHADYKRIVLERARKIAPEVSEEELERDWEISEKILG